MATDVTTLIVAAFGMSGTLAAPFVTQWAASRTKRVDSVLERALHSDDRLAAEARTRFEERREIYTELNALARSVRVLYKDCVRTWREIGAEVLPQLGPIDDERKRFLAAYSRAQMMLPAEVLEEVSRTSLLLGRGYGILKTLIEQENPDPDAANAFYDGELYAAIRGMRQRMRQDLGVEG